MSFANPCYTKAVPLAPHYTPEEYQDYLRRQYGDADALAYGRFINKTLPPTPKGRVKQRAKICQDLLETLHCHGPQTPLQLAENSGYSRSSVGKYLGILLEAKEVVRCGGSRHEGFQYKPTKSL